MEVATTNKTTTNTSNHHYHNFLEHHNHHQEQQRMPHHTKNNLSVGLISETTTTTGNGVGAVGGGGGGARSPFQREVREWQRIDPDTGALLSGRLEADRWINGPMNSYGKISDSQNISQPNGTQHTQRKQLEVLQARTANGAMQVIRTQTSSRWSSATSSSASSSAVASPTIISSGALTNGHNNHNNNNSTHNSSNNISNNFHNSNQLFQLHQQHLNNHNNMKHNHFQSPSFGRLDLSPPPLISTLEITEVSNDDSDSNDHNVNHFCSRSSSGSSVQSSNHDRPNNGSDLEDIDDDSKSDVVQQQHHHQPLKTDVGGSNDFFNRHSFLNKSHNNITNRNLSLLMETLDTAPSLKLINLMKSNSSLSSNNSSNNSTTATMNSNTHQRGGSAAAKISLHAVVSGGGSGGVGAEEPIKQRTSSAASSSSSTTKTTTKTNRQQQKQQQPQQRKSQLLEQATLYGNNSVNLSPSLTKSRVGVNADESVAVIVDCANAAAAVVDHDDDNDDDHNDGAGRLKRNGGNMTPTQLKTRQHHRDLESFRHYNEHGNKTATSLNTTVAVDRSNDDSLRLNSRHRRHQQASTTTVPIQRSRSISTENLNSDHRDKKTHSYENDEDEDLEPSEWKRVSKLRRSFQSSNSNSSKSDISIQQPRRPIDLPTNSSVSVAKIRAELENGRRLNTAMRNNHIDLAALDSILNGSADESSSKPIPAKRNSFLTAESLKEIRAGLKKLSDESLYRDDYVAATQAAPDEHIEIQDVKKPPERIRLNQPTPENFAETTSAPKSAFEIFTRQAPTNSYVITAPKHTTHSLESRQKHRDSATSIDWHLRRKSYGFEKMSPPDDKAMCRMDASTDSGLGRSGEQLGNWSPTNTTNAPINTHATVIQFGTPTVKTETNIATSNTAIKPAIQKRYRPLKSPNFNNDDNEAEQKRHSIAVDESQYVRKISQVRVNSVYDSSAEYSPKAMQTTRFPENIDISNISNARNNTQQKRVEFCKTEVHFAAESGRVNIVETDGKPPPTNNFRRRRRTTSGPLQTLMKSSGIVSTTDNTTSKPITLFGDAANEHKVLSQTTVAYRASLIEAKKDANADVANSVTFTMPKAISLDTFGHSESSRSSYASTSTSGIESTDCETDEISAIRGILKNKPIKPKPYHLGENIDSADALWGVRLKSVDAVQSQEPVSAFSTTSSSSVGERVRLAEQRQDAANSLSQVNNFSTKINLSLGNECNTEQQEGAVSEYVTEVRRASVHELMLQDLREHQRVLDEGLKSTSLIIKTMRSANEFDEAMRRLSIASLEAAIIPPIVVPTPMLRSHSYQGTSRRSSVNSVKTSLNTSLTILRRCSTEIDDISEPTTQPTSAQSNLNLFGNTEIPVSQPLTQLRRLYDLANVSGTSQDEDSADEEVKRLLSGGHQRYQQQESSDSGGGTQGSSSFEDERFTEYSSSWSRLKAKRTIWRIGANESNKVARTLERAELPKSNVMSIELHSPQTSLERHDATKLKEGTTTAPIPKPRTFTEAKNMEQPQIHIATTVKQTTGQNSSKETNRDFLKIVKETRGARKLREHELSYFGVPIPTKQAEIESISKFTSVTQFPKSKRSLPQRKQNDYPRTELISDLAKQQQLSTKWQLFNDKPDLLQHSPVAVQPHIITHMADIKPTEQKSLSPKSPNCGFENDEHVYENIATNIKPVFKVKSPVRMLSPNYDQHLYDRKADLKRDAMILNEMTQSADQTMKAISDEAAIKEQRRHRSSSQRRHAKPLETIDEKIKAEKINGNCIAVQITRSTTAATDAKRMTRQGTPTHTTVSSRARTSSQSSSNDSCPRARSRSLSSEREYETFNVRSKRTSQSATRSRPLKYATAVAAVPSRSSSRESATHAVRCCSSGDERDQKNIKRVVRSSRSRQTTANAIRSGDSKKTTNSKDSQRHHHHSDKSQRRDDEHSKKRVSSSTAHSSRRERVECNDEAKTQQHSHHSSQHKSYERSLGDGSKSRTGESSSSRSKPREEQHKSLSSSQRATASDKRERDRLRTNEQQHHNHQARESSQHRSSHQRTDRDKEKENSSRSKGHSSRSSQQKSSDRSVSSKTREQQHKKSTQQQQSNTESKNYEPMKSSSTHSKNIPLLNGHQHQHHHHHHQHQQQKQQEPHNGHHNEHEHKHKLTTATIAAKQREHRSGKDRK